LQAFAQSSGLFLQFGGLFLPIFSFGINGLAGF